MSELRGILNAHEELSAELNYDDLQGIINYGSRGARGLGIKNVALNPDNTITIVLENGNTITTHSIYPIEGNIQWGQIENKPFSTIGENLKIENGTLAVDTVSDAIEDNTKPITSGAVYTEIGNIDVLLTAI